MKETLQPQLGNKRQRARELGQEGRWTKQTKESGRQRAVACHVPVARSVHRAAVKCKQPQRAWFSGTCNGGIEAGSVVAGEGVDSQEKRSFFFCVLCLVRVEGSIECGSWAEIGVCMDAAARKRVRSSPSAHRVSNRTAVPPPQLCSSGMWGRLEALL